MIRLVFVIGALTRGGAERQLTLLVTGIDRNRFAVTVVTLTDGGALRGEIEALDGVAVVSLRKRGRWDIVAPLWRLVRLARAVRPHIVHGYLDATNVVSLLTGKLAGAQVVWGLRASNVHFANYDQRWVWIHRLAGWLSRFADLIVVNSHAGKHHHVSEGFCGKRMLVIPNGFDTEQFRPDEVAGRRMRGTWGIAEDETLIGLVARLDPMKDHDSFLRAASLLLQERRNVRFVCVGDGPAPHRQELLSLAAELGVGDRVIWAGELQDMSAVQNALDIATSASAYGEGFSNAIGEAMACGVPCVVTDVGDSAALVGSTGLVVQPGRPTALVTAWTRLLDMAPDERKALGRAARDRVSNEYSIQQLVARTESALTSLVSRADGNTDLDIRTLTTAISD